MLYESSYSSTSNHGRWFYLFFYKMMKYVSCEFDCDYIVDTQLCKLRNMSRLYPVFTEFSNFMIKSRSFYKIMKYVSCEFDLLHTR